MAGNMTKLDLVGVILNKILIPNTITIGYSLIMDNRTKEQKQNIIWSLQAILKEAKEQLLNKNNTPGENLQLKKKIKEYENLIKKHKEVK